MAITDNHERPLLLLCPLPAAADRRAPTYLRVSSSVQRFPFVFLYAPSYGCSSKCTWIRIIQAQSLHNSRSQLRLASEARPQQQQRPTCNANAPLEVKSSSRTRLCCPLVHMQPPPSKPDMPRHLSSPTEQLLRISTLLVSLLLPYRLWPSQRDLPAAEYLFGPICNHQVTV